MIAYVALGSNLGDRAATIAAAVELLRQTPGIEIKKLSALLENPAVGGPPDSPPFLNAVAEIDTTLSAADLLGRLLSIEAELGRQRHQRWAPRNIDLDLILYGREIIESPGLTVPHPRMHERRFVLQPLAEIAPLAVHPQLKKTAADLLRYLCD
ncbi:MAG TPA: 2-amino-4-hydroxy-6-hydroxymethyldihydropteridine diphosphokinase [Tepidisphaeraceae bacterium]|nr:2-amino-4-hydroxy-6-hydroxymethyldihydropteridine diphosphokinase [Tepidisphaeraceae bacterium]